MADRARVVLRKREIKELMESDAMVAVVVDRANEVVPKAKAKAPVSAAGSHGRKSGYLRANIRTRYARDAIGVYADVTTNARTPKGFPYGKLQEKRQPYLKPSIE